MAVKELTQLTPIHIIGDGSNLLDWSITGAAGGVGKLGLNYLKQEEKSVDNMCADARYRGNVNISFQSSTAYPDVPSNEDHAASYKQWLNVSYDKYTLDAQNNKYYIDDRPKNYDYAQYKTQLQAGSYKLIFEGYSSGANWAGERLSRNGFVSASNIAPAEFHLYKEILSGNLFDFAAWAAIVSQNTIGTGTAGVNRGDGTWDYTNKTFTMTKNNVSGWLASISAYNTLTTQSSKIPQITVSDDNNLHSYELKFYVDTNISNVHLEVRVANGTTNDYVINGLIYEPDENGYITVNFETTATTVSIAFAIDSQTYGVVQGDYITFSNIQICKSSVSDYRIIPSEHTNEKFIHQEFAFTLTEANTVGLYFLGFRSNLNRWSGRFMIVDSDTISEQFTIGNVTGFSCWEPYGYSLLLSVIGGGGITEIKFPLGDTLLQEGSTISLFSTGIAIPTYYGETVYRVDSEVQPTMYIRFNEGTIVDMYAEPRPAMINVFGILEDQNNFAHNGIAVLMPFSCESYKEDKGRWDLTLTHPIDDYGKWTYIVGQNVLKVSGQLYRIDQTEVYSDADQEYISAHAKHITYDLADRFIGETTFTVEDGTEYLAKLIYESGKLIPTQSPTHEYSFDLSSDIEGPMSADIHDQTVIGAIFGDDNSMCSRFAGEVYRSNFHISVNEKMEGAPEDNAFSIRYGTDLTKISFRIDFSEWITELICEDNFGAVFGVSYVGSEWIIHHHKTKIVRFTYADMVNPDYDMERLIKDGQAYWETVSTPKVSIEVSVANIKTDPKYKDFLNLQNFDVGYKGTVYVEHLNIEVEMKIISIRRNELTGEIIALTLGNTRRSLIRSPVMSQTIVSANSATDKLAVSLQQQLIEMQTDLMASSISGMETFRITDLERRTINELEGN